VFFNSGRWIEEMRALRELFPSAWFAYRTGGNEIMKAPLERTVLPTLVERQAFWVASLSDCLDELITNSAYTEARLAALGLAPSLFVRSVGGVNLPALRGHRPAPHHEGTPQFVCAARFVPYKRHGLLLAVVAELRRRGRALSVRLVGDGPLETDLRRQVRELDLEGCVTFLGALSNEDCCREIASADFYIQLSGEVVTQVPGGEYVHAEGMGRSLLEALSCGTFVVATEGGALAEIVTPDRGVLLPDAPAEILAGRIEALLETPPARAALLTEWDWSAVFRRYETRWEGRHAAAARD
jgi:glycosyltransferase involved in cell wall biosynthesis